MEKRSSKLYRKLQRLRFFNSRNNTKAFLQKANRNKQRLIPLTSEIEKAMMDSESSTSDTISITTLELSMSNQFGHNDEVNDVIKECLIKEKVTTYKHIIKNINKLELRITALEGRLNVMHRNISQLKHVLAKEFDINAVKQKLSRTQKLDTKNEKETPEDKGNYSVDIDSRRELLANTYDEIFYSTREYNMNLLNYKKSSESFELNKKAEWNPYVRPVNIVLPPQKRSKKFFMFLATK